MASTIILVRRAMDGDRCAWNDLAEKYYESWLRKFHGSLGATVKRFYETADLVQSAIGYLPRDTWATSATKNPKRFVRIHLGEARKTWTLPAGDLGSRSGSDSDLAGHAALAQAARTR